MKMKVPISIGNKIIETEVDIDITTILKEIPKPILKGVIEGKWEENKDSGYPLEKLKGIKSVEKSLIFDDRAMIRVVFKGEISKKDMIAEYGIDFIESARKCGAEWLLLFDKDYPAIADLGNGWYMVIAPRIDR